MEEKIMEIQKALDEAHIMAEVYQYNDLPVICVAINSGDWKHDHLRADWLVKELGGTKLGENTTYEDGSDCYSAIHNFYF